MSDAREFFMVIALGFALGCYAGVKAATHGVERETPWMEEGLVAWTNVVKL
jgi:hypothetical protein